MNLKITESNISFGLFRELDESSKTYSYRVVPSQVTCPYCRVELADTSYSFTFEKCFISVRCPKCGLQNYGCD